MSIIANQNQTLETNQLCYPKQNLRNKNMPDINETNINPTFNPTINPIISPTITQNPNISPIIKVSPSFIINQEQPKIEIKPTRTIMSAAPNFGPESKVMNCPFCKEPIHTEINKTMNMKAICIAIGTCYIGLCLIQMFNNKNIGCEDVEHKCPNCGYIIGTYYAM